MGPSEHRAVSNLGRYRFELGINPNICPNTTSKTPKNFKVAAVVLEHKLSVAQLMLVLIALRLLRLRLLQNIVYLASHLGVIFRA